jgi:hypothetical protein
MSIGIFVLILKDSNVKKRKFLLHGPLKIVYQIYHANPEKKKRKSNLFYPDKNQTFFIPDNFMFP